MKKTIHYTITTKESGINVGAFLKQEGYSGSLIRRLKNTDEGITLNGKPVHTPYKLSHGECLSISLPEDEPSGHIVPTSMHLDICYEDEDLLVINKAAGVPIHPSQGNFDNTLANGIAWYQQEIQHSTPGTYRVITRLDRNTTGLVLLAKHGLSACILSDMVKNRHIHRYYLAAAQGKVFSSGIVDAPIARVSDSTIERCVDFELGESARTHYRLLHYDPASDYSLIALKLETGRTHQIRVHMRYIGHPLPGDFLYNPNDTYIKRQALHSFRLDFVHPLKKVPLHFEAPIPDDMKFMGITSIEGLWEQNF